MSLQDGLQWLAIAGVAFNAWVYYRRSEIRSERIEKSVKAAFGHHNQRLRALEKRTLEG